MAVKAQEGNREAGSVLICQRKQESWQPDSKGQYLTGLSCRAPGMSGGRETEVDPQGKGDRRSESTVGRSPASRHIAVTS